MHPAKRIEITTDSVELAKILDALHKASVTEHTVIRNVVSKSRRIEATELDNVYVIAFCLPDNVNPVVENIRPILNKFGGTCYISDAMEITSVRCVASL